MKKIAIKCAKKKRRKHVKKKRASKENVFRQKKLHREMIIFWKRKVKEMNENKRKR